MPLGKAGGRTDVRARGSWGRVVATQGRRVVVRGEDGAEILCWLSGQRAVIGDRACFLPSGQGEGKLTAIGPRERALGRSDFKGREQEVASHLGGMLVCGSVVAPAWRPALVDRYQVAADQAGLEVIIVATKTDLGVPQEVADDLAQREALGTPVVRVSTTTGEGIEALRAVLAAQEVPGPWVMVGPSGVGKTSLAAVLLPEQDVGPVGEISAYWDTGRHTTTHSRIFASTDGYEIADSPGIRSFLPSGLEAEVVRDHFPGIGPLPCRYRDCLHRPEEDGCAAEATVPAEVLLRYRQLLQEVLDVAARARP